MKRCVGATSLEAGVTYHEVPAQYKEGLSLYGGQRHPCAGRAGHPQIVQIIR